MRHISIASSDSTTNRSNVPLGRFIDKLSGSACVSLHKMPISDGAPPLKNKVEADSNPQIDYWGTNSHRDGEI